jgi:hypothetical protein
MHNQHTDLSQTLADQHRTQLQDQATQARLAAGPPRRRRRRRAWLPRRWWQLARWPGVPTDQPVTRPPKVS